MLMLLSVVSVCVCVFVYFEETFLFSKEFCFPHHTHRQTNDKRWKERKASQLWEMFVAVIVGCLLYANDEVCSD